MNVGTALAVPCNARAANATDLRARYPGAAGPVRPAANTATAKVHTTFTPEQIRWAFGWKHLPLSLSAVLVDLWWQ